MYATWIKWPGCQNIKKKHSLDALLWSTVGMLVSGLTPSKMEGVAGIAAKTLARDFWQLIDVINDVFDYEMQPMTPEERKICEGSISVSPNTVAIVDGVDFSVRVGLAYSKLFYSHKVNVFKQHAMRAQIRVDTYWGLFRGLLVAPAGIHNDQSMITSSDWNKPDSGLLSNNQNWGADGGYHVTDNILFVTPANDKELQANPQLKYFNQEFNQTRKKIEREFAQLKGRFEILDKPYCKDIKRFEKILGACMKLMNRWWRLNGYFFHQT